MDIKPIGIFTSSLVEETIKMYQNGIGVKNIAAMHCISYEKTVKILVTAGVYTSEIYDNIKQLRESGKSDPEVCEIMAITADALNRYTPYKKGLYNSEHPTINALRIRRCREKKNLESH